MKTLVICDTNQINSENYKTGSLGRNFNTLVEYSQNNNLENELHILMPNMVKQEIFTHKMNSYKEDKRLYCKSEKQLKQTPGITISSIIPDDNIFERNLLSQMDTEINKFSNVKKCKLSERKKATALDSIIKNCAETPDRLKDQIIIEEAKAFPYLNNYEKVIIFTSNKADFINYIPSNWEIITAETDLYDKLDAIYAIPETTTEKDLVNFLKDDYSKEKIETFLLDETGEKYKVKELTLGYTLSEEEDSPIEEFIADCKVINLETSKIESLLFTFDNIKEIVDYEFV